MEAKDKERKGRIKEENREPEKSLTTLSSYPVTYTLSVIVYRDMTKEKRLGRQELRSPGSPGNVCSS